MCVPLPQRGREAGGEGQTPRPLHRINNAPLWRLSALAFITTVSLASLHSAIAAESPAVAVATAEDVSGVSVPRYNGLRIADLAPEWTLPDDSATGKLWSSRDQLGQHAILMVVVGDKPAPAVGVRVALMNSLQHAARSLRLLNLMPVLVLSGNTAIRTEQTTASDLVLLHDENSELAKLLGPSPTGMTLVAIDKAGFLRHSEPIQDPLLAAPRLHQIGDPTPHLEVGKPAPDFCMTDMYGRIHRLADLRGQKNLLLTFFPKCFTGG